MDKTMSYEIDVLSRISERFVEMSESEQRVAQVILDNVKAASEMSIARLSESAGVSQATVTRFARTVDCKDVRQLKVKLAQSLAANQQLGLAEAIVRQLGDGLAQTENKFKQLADAVALPDKGALTPVAPEYTNSAFNQPLWPVENGGKSSL